MRLLDILVFGVFIFFVVGNILAWMRWRRRVRNSSAGMPLWFGRQVGAGWPSGRWAPKAGTKEEFTDDEDQRDSADAEEVVESRFVADHHVAGNGVEQHFQGCCRGCSLASILMNSTPMTMSSARSRNDRISTSLPSKQQARHPLEQGNEGEQQPDEHQPGQHDLQQGGGLNDDVVLQGSLRLWLSTWEVRSGLSMIGISFTSEIWGKTQTFFFI